MTEFGVGTYTRNIVRALGRLDRENKYFLLGSPEKVAEIGSLPANFHALPLLQPDTTVKGYLDCRAILKRLDCDLVHIPYLFSLPRTLPCPYVVLPLSASSLPSNAPRAGSVARQISNAVTKPGMPTT